MFRVNAAGRLKPTLGFKLVMNMNLQHGNEVKTGSRFAFGKNWMKFLDNLDEQRIHLAEQSICSMLKVKDLKNKSFLDVGSGSGLFSLAAKNLGAVVYSFDYDPKSVACTEELKRRYYPDDAEWQIGYGSVLDVGYLNTMGQWDVVYSWGVLHHTGDLWQALENVKKLVSKDGRLFLAIYNDQGRASKTWLKVKKLYNKLPSILRGAVLYPAIVRLWGPTMVRELLAGKPFETWINYSKVSLRGMSPWYDIVDWVGYHLKLRSLNKYFEFIGIAVINWKKLRHVLVDMVVMNLSLGRHEYYV